MIEKHYVVDAFVCPKCGRKEKIVWARYTDRHSRPERIGVRCSCGDHYQRKIRTGTGCIFMPADNQNIPVYHGGLMTPK